MPAQDSLSSTESPAADYGSSSDLPRLEYYLINAFETGKPGSGNQASVVIFPSPSDPRSKDDAFLLRTAQDFGFSETAYLVPIAPEEGRWGLRWFTPEVVSMVS
jgi:predicted PhzF superfamily epimerase YddE/YHI9